jgi:hypothetical protein
MFCTGDNHTKHGGRNYRTRKSRLQTQHRNQCQLILERIKPFRLLTTGRNIEFIWLFGNGQIIMFQIKKTNAFEIAYVKTITPLKFAKSI